MADKTGISYVDSTWNVVTGCTPVSEGCRNCWARVLHNQRARARVEGKQMPAQYAKPFSVVQLLDERMEQPLHWKRPRRIFVASTGDLWHERVPFSFVNRAFEVMARTPQHTYIVLTKRAERMAMWALARDRAIPANVWGGVSVENQAAADARIPWLVKVGFVVNFVSCEPLLGPVHLPMGLLDWVICGGESGAQARPMYVGWVRSLANQCREAERPFYFKQWGEWCHGLQPQIRQLTGKKIHRWEDGSCSLWVGKARAGHCLDGEELRELPGGAF